MLLMFRPKKGLISTTTKMNGLNKTYLAGRQTVQHIIRREGRRVLGRRRRILGARTAPPTHTPSHPSPLPPIPLPRHTHKSNPRGKLTSAKLEEVVLADTLSAYWRGALSVNHTLTQPRARVSATHPLSAQLAVPATAIQSQPHTDPAPCTCLCPLPAVCTACRTCNSNSK